MVIGHSIIIDGHKTSVSLEEAYWKGLREIAEERGETLAHLIASIDTNRQNANLSSPGTAGLCGERVGCEASPRTS